MFHKQINQREFINLSNNIYILLLTPNNIAKQNPKEKLSETFCRLLSREDHPFVFISFEDILILYDDPAQARNILENFLLDNIHTAQKIRRYMDDLIRYSHKSKKAFYLSSKSSSNIQCACVSAMYSKGLEKGVEIAQQYRQEKFGSRLVLST